MDKINNSYVQLLNGILIVKQTRTKIIKCEFVDEKNTIKMFFLKNINIDTKWNVKFFDFDKIIKNNISQNKIPLEQDVIYKLMRKFESKLSNIFGNKSCMHLFLYYFINLLINKKNQLVVLDDTQNIIQSLITLFVPDYFKNKEYVCNRTFLFENESWKQNELLNLLYSHNLFDETNAKIVGLNSVINNETLVDFNIIRINNSENFGSEINESNRYLNSCIMLYIIINIINKTNRLLEIKPLYNEWLRQYLEHRIR